MSSQSPSLFSSSAAFDIAVYDFQGAARTAAAAAVAATSFRPIHSCALCAIRGRRLLQFFPPFILRSA